MACIKEKDNQKRHMAEIVEYIPELKDVDAEIFHKNLNRELTQEEIIEIRKWALGYSSMLK
jgi:predicted transcriptional regulator